jgi:hypothetical protein
MGFFSKTCAKTHLPVVHDGRGFLELSEVVALYPDGRRLTGFMMVMGASMVKSFAPAVMTKKHGTGSNSCCAPLTRARTTKNWASPTMNSPKGTS